jgi:hypothetical protein
VFGTTSLGAAAAQLPGRFQSGRTARLQRHHEVGRQDADPGVRGAVRGRDLQQPLLDLIDRLAGRGERAAQVEQELLKLSLIHAKQGKWIGRTGDSSGANDAGSARHREACRIDE